MLAEQRTRNRSNSSRNDTREQATPVEAQAASTAASPCRTIATITASQPKGAAPGARGPHRAAWVRPAICSCDCSTPREAELAEVEDSGADEGVINYTFPEDGNYTLFVEDLLHHGGPDHVYRVEFRPYRAGFTLTADADKFDVPQGGSLHDQDHGRAQWLPGTDRIGIR